MKALELQKKGRHRMGQVYRRKLQMDRLLSQKDQLSKNEAEKL